MTKKDYVKFAEMIKLDRNTFAGSELGALAYIQEQIADIFAQDNEQFDWQRFYDACEPKKPKVQVKDPTCVLCDYGEVHEH